MMGLAPERAEHKTIMIDATYLKAHRTASSQSAPGSRRQLVGVATGGAARLGEMYMSDSKCGTFSRLRPLGPPAPVLRGKDNGTRGLSCLDTRLGLRLLRQRCRQRGPMFTT